MVIQKKIHTHTTKGIKVLMLTLLTCLNTSGTLGNTKIPSNKLFQQVSTKYELILTHFWQIIVQLQAINFGSNCSLSPHTKFLGVFELRIILLNYFELFYQLFATIDAHCRTKRYRQVSTMGKQEIEKFSRDNNFALKLQEILTQEKCIESLNGEASMHVHLTQVEKMNMMYNARSVIILCLGDKDLRDVIQEKTTILMWVKLKSLYMNKSLTHVLCMKQQLY